MSFIIFLSFIFVINSCSNKNYLNRINKNIHVDNCNYDNAKKISDSLFNTEFKDNIRNYDVNISENDTCYTFNYLHKIINNVRTLGGGGEIMISKKNCKVISIIGYQ